METIRIGRSIDNEIVLQDQTVSRNHASINENEGNFTLTDNDSSNGTFINGNRIYGTVKLDKHDILKVGNVLVPWMNYINGNAHAEKTTIQHEGNSQESNLTHQNERKVIPVPLANGALVLGILSIIFTTGALIGLILGIIGISNSNKGLKLYYMNPQAYDPSSANVAKAGKVCAIIGVILSSVVILWWTLILIAIANHG